MCGKYKSETPKCNLNCYNPNYSKPFLKDISKGRLMENPLKLNNNNNYINCIF